MYDYVLMMFYDHIMGMSQNQLPHATPQQKPYGWLGWLSDRPTVAIWSTEVTIGKDTKALVLWQRGWNILDARLDAQISHLGVSENSVPLNPMGINHSNITIN